MRLKLKYVRRVRAKGRTYWYFRHRGIDMRLPEEPGHPAFHVRYQELLDGLNVPAKIGLKAPAPSHGSYEAIRRDYLASPDFSELADKTRQYRRYNLDLIAGLGVGSQQLTTLTARDVYRLRDAFKETPGKANQLVSSLSAICSWAVERGLIANNPAYGIKRLKLGEHEPWPDFVLDYALKEASPMLRLAIILHLTTGQRIADVCAMTHHQITDGTIEVTQSKTGTTVWLPVHPLLATELAKVERNSVYILYNRHKKPFKPDTLRARLARILKPKGWGCYTPHGLRKNATIYMVEMGLSENAVASITGHKNLDMIRHYAKRHDRKKLAKAVGKTWERDENVYAILGKSGKPKVENR